MNFLVRLMTDRDVPGAVALQKLAFPPPFSEDLHWDPEHLIKHIESFPAGQFVAEFDGNIVGSCSNTLITEARWQAHENWYQTVGGPELNAFSLTGTTLYGLDITVHPDVRRNGIGRSFYEARFQLVRTLSLSRYGTGCRIPDFLQHHGKLSVEQYAENVVQGRLVDRTLTPLLHFGLSFVQVIRNYMPDPESANAGVLLEWRP